MAVVTSSDVWTVGHSADNTLIEHWDGSQWSVVPSPDLGTDVLIGVATVAANDVWTVGYYTLPGQPGQTLALHWDGASWSIIPTPTMGSSSYLRAVTAVAADDVWAVGYYTGVSVYQTLIEHWDGTYWSVIPSPNLGSLNNILYDSFAVSAADIWAVGMTYMSSSQALILHWDGSQWSISTNPHPGSDGRLFSVSATSSNDLWAVGDYFDGTRSATLTLHGDGMSWTVVPSPSIGTIATNELYGVTAVTPNDAWAVGYQCCDNNRQDTVVLQWDGSAWIIAPNPSPGTIGNVFYSVAAVSANDVWAVGSYRSTGIYGTLIEHYGGVCPTPTPTLLPTVAPPTPAPSATPKATAPPTPCPLQFTDVPESNPFYPYIRCLACRQILSGYSASPPCAPGAAPCFLPAANVTRGQIAKIVANAAGFTDAIPSTQQTFEDVPLGHPFWPYIERLAQPGRGIITGYVCGQAPAGPCVPPGNRPYFLPGAPVTRGQLAKIDAGAAGLSNPIPSTQQTFEDVPPGHPSGSISSAWPRHM